MATVLNQLQIPFVPYQQRAPLQTPERLQKDHTPPSPLVLGLRPIQQYDYLNIARARIESGSLPFVKENIRKIKSSSYEYYYFEDWNPIVAQVQLSGQILWKAIAPCNGNDVKAIGNFLTLQNQSVHVNTGCHGNRQGMMPADGEFYLANDMQEPAFFNEDTRAFNHVPNKVSFLQVSAYVRPIYPEKANHTIDAWCFSFKTLFTDIKNHLIPKDLKGDFIPTLFKDVVTHQLMKEPMYSPECSVIHGRTHYYDRETIEDLIDQNSERMDVVGMLPALKWACDDLFRKESYKLKRRLVQEDPNKTIKCRLAECGKIIHISTFLFDPQLKEEIYLYRMTLKNVRQLREKDSANLQKINILQQDMLNKTQRINFLETELGTKDQTIVGLNQENTTLKGRVTVEIAEKQQLKLKNREITRIAKRQRDVIDELEQGIIPEDLQEVQEMAVAFQNAFIQEPQVKARERVALMELGDFSIPLNMPVFLKNAQKRIAVTNELLKELKNFDGLLTQGWIYQPTPFIKKGETQSEEFLESHVQAFRRYIAEVVKPPYNTIIHEASCQLVLKLDGEFSLYKDILKITSEPFLKLQRNLQSTELLWRELEGTLDNVHLDFHSLLKDKRLKLKTPTRQDYHVVSSQIIRHDPEVFWEQQEKAITEIAVIGSKTYATKLSEILSRLMAIRWCEENNRILNQFLNSCM